MTDQDDSNEQTIQRQAAAWVVRTGAGRLSSRDTRALETWMREDERHRDAFREMGGVWFDTAAVLNGAVAVPRISLSRLLRAWWATGHGRKQAAGLAAMAALLVAAIWIAMQSEQVAAPDSEYRHTARTLVGENSGLVLPDGSRVTLNTDTVLSVDYSRGERAVRLAHGEALFEVAHERQRPFRVYAGRNLIEAVGTAFRVRGVGRTEVTVTRGQVRLSLLPSEGGTSEGADTSREEIALVSAGRNAIFEQDRVVVEALDAKSIEKRLSWQDGVLVFDGDTLADAVREFARYTETDIVILDEDIVHRHIVGVFSTGDLDRFMQALQTRFDIRVSTTSQGVVLLGEDPPGDG